MFNTNSSFIYLNFGTMQEFSSKKKSAYVNYMLNSISEQKNITTAQTDTINLIINLTKMKLLDEHILDVALKQHYEDMEDLTVDIPKLPSCTGYVLGQLIKESELFDIRRFPK